MQLSQHIGKAAWSTADKLLYVLIGLAFILPQKVIGERNYGVYAYVQAMLTALYMLTDSLALLPMVNFGMDPERRREAYTVSALMHLLFVGICTSAIYLGRDAIAVLLNNPLFSPTLALFPFVAFGFLLRSYFLKVAQLHINTRATFLIDLAWIGTTIALILVGWQRGTLATAEDMMVISAISSGASSLVGLLLYGGTVRFTRQLDRKYVMRMFRFGLAQSGSAATLALQTQGDIMILGMFVRAELVGNYDAAKKFFRGFEALRDAGSLFVYPAAAKLAAEHREEELVVLVEKMIAFMLVVIVPIVIFVWVAPIDKFFDFVYKGKYLDAPMIFRILSLAALAIPFSMTMYVLGGMGEARRYFRVTLGSAVASLVVSLALVPYYGAVGTAIAAIISYGVLGFLSTRSVAARIPISLRRTLGRWRDAVNFATKFIKRKL